VRAKQEEYLKANKREKTLVAKDIVKLIRMLTPPGRFLKKDNRDENVYGRFIHFYGGSCFCCSLFALLEMERPFLFWKILM